MDSGIKEIARMVAEIPDAQRSAAARPLPGIQPVDGPWVTVDGAYAFQLAQKAELMRQRRNEVCAEMTGAHPACLEALRIVLKELEQQPAFDLTGDQICCPDGRMVEIDSGDPLLTLSQLLQEDICIIEKRSGAHMLTAALLCFPASWTLAEKIGRPLAVIHGPVEDYGDELDRRVARLFDAVREEQPLWRANLLRYDEPDLFQPRREGDQRPNGDSKNQYERSERQTLIRLPQTGAVIFAIHTKVAAI